MTCPCFITKSDVYFDSYEDDAGADGSPLRQAQDRLRVQSPALRINFAEWARDKVYKGGGLIALAFFFALKEQVPAGINPEQDFTECGRMCVCSVNR